MAIRYKINVIDALKASGYSTYRIRKEKLLHEIARELSQGNIDADPCSHGPQDNACTYCEFASACCFEDGRGSDRMRPIGKVEPDAFWQFVEKKAGEEEAHG